jgi:hypothetical protein
LNIDRLIVCNLHFVHNVQLSNNDRTGARPVNVTRRILYGDAIVAMGESLGPWRLRAPDAAPLAARQSKSAIAERGS